MSRDLDLVQFERDFDGRLLLYIIQLISCSLWSKNPKN